MFSCTYHLWLTKISALVRLVKLPLIPKKNELFLVMYCFWNYLTDGARNTKNEKKINNTFNVYYV